MQKLETLTGWRKVGLVAGTLAVLTAGVGATAAQALDPGQSAAVLTAGAGAAGAQVLDPGSEIAPSGKHASKQASKHAKASEWTPAPDCSDLRADMTFTSAPEAAQALKTALASVAEGTISGARAERVSATCHHPENVMATSTLAPADGSSDVQVSASFLAPGEFDYAGGAEAYVSTCDTVDAGIDDCEVSTLADGTTLRTYSLSQKSGGVDTTWQVAERLVDGYIVSVNAIGAEALSSDEVADIASQLTPLG